MRFRIDLKIFILIILFFITNQIKIYAMIMIFAIIHEFGHLLAGLIVGMKPEKIEIRPLGVSVEFNIKEKDYNVKIKKGNLLEVKKIFVALAGPLTNVLIICILSTVDIINVSYNDKLLMIYSNILLIIFNIFPIYPLDGGRILKGIIYLLKGKYIAEKYIYNISFITLIVLTIFASIIILYLRNVAIFLAIMFLWGILIREKVIYENRKILYKNIECELKNLKNPIENKLI